MEKSYRFLPYFFAAFAVAMIALFYRTYFGLIPHFEGSTNIITGKAIPINGIIHAHTMTMVLWLLLLIIQPILIVKKQVKWHKALGRFSYFFFIVIIISMLAATYNKQTRDPSLPAFNSNILDYTTFIAFYILAVYFRKKTDYHTRFMVMSTFPLIQTAFARIPGPGVIAVGIMFVILFAIEVLNRKIYKPYLLGFSVYIFFLMIWAYLRYLNPMLLEQIWQFLFN